jgi:hypothetical protein
MSKLRGVSAAFLMLALFVVGILFGSRWANWRLLKSGPKIYSTPVLLKQVQSLSELVTVKYVLEKVQAEEIPSENLIGQVIGSQNKILLLAHGVVKAGIDLKEIKPEDISISDKKITMTLPPPQITDAYLDDKLTKVIDRTTGILAPPDKDLEQTTRQHAIDDIRRAARENNILKEADDRARLQLTILFHQLGFSEVEFR